MKNSGATSALLALLLGCAGGSDPGESGTEIGDGTAGDDTSGDPGTSSTSSSTPPSTDSTSGVTTSTSTTAAPESSSSSNGSSSTGSAESTGSCVKSTEGCPCDPASDPECGVGLACNEQDICVASACGPQADEPNGDPFDPAPLTDLGPDDDPVTIMSQLDGQSDVDWFQWNCSEPFLGLTTPDLDVTAPAGIRTCLFLDCPVGGNPSLECPEGTTPMNAPVDNMPGCCVVGTAAFSVDPGPNCPEGTDDVIINLRVDEGEKNMCSSYTFSYEC